MKAIITKYALSSGVSVLDGYANREFPTMFTPDRKHGFIGSLHGKDWHKDKQSALDHLVSMVNKKRASLQRQLAQIESKHAKAIRAIEAADLT